MLREAEVFDEVVVTPRRAFPRHPDLQVIERPGWLQIVTPSLTTGGLNEVIHAELADADADAAIADAIAGYRARGLKFRWAVGPGSAPADLGARLVRAGLVESWGRGMARAIADAPAARLAPGIAIAEVDATTVDAFSNVMAAGWEMAPGPIAALHRVLLAAPDRREQMFLASIDGVPAATASYIAFPRSAFLIGAVVLPAFRGRGLYRALVEARLDHARARGLPLATSHAREATSAPILEHLGFATIVRFPMYFG